MKYLKTKLKCFIGLHTYKRKSRTALKDEKFHKQVFKQCIFCLKEK